MDELSTSAENAQVRLEGNREIKRTVKIYNLDMIISVGLSIVSGIRLCCIPIGGIVGSVAGGFAYRGIMFYKFSHMTVY